MNEEGINMLELFIDKVASIVLDSLTDEEIMNIVNDEVYWGGEECLNSFFDSEIENQIQHYEEMYQEFLMIADQSYFDELAEIENIKKEILMVA